MKVDDAKVWAQENPAYTALATAGVGVTLLTAGAAFLSHLRKEAAYRKADQARKRGRKGDRMESRIERRELESEARGFSDLLDIDEDELIELVEAYLDQLDV